jgi:flavin reductase (DIM6/NTAB) family NADH-FMN oxidoreductase RutF
MKISQGAKLLAVPTPVWLVGTYGKDGKANLMAAAWAGICNSDPPCIQVSIRPTRLTYESIVQRKSFTISIPSEEYWVETDYTGMVSGRDADKFEDTLFTPVKGDHVDAPYVDECGIVVECTLRQVVDLGSHMMVIGEIADVKVDEEAISDGNFDVQMIKPFIYSMGDNSYHAMGVRLGDALKQSTPPE